MWTSTPTACPASVFPGLARPFQPPPCSLSSSHMLHCARRAAHVLGMRSICAGPHSIRELTPQLGRGSRSLTSTRVAPSSPTVDHHRNRHTETNGAPPARPRASLSQRPPPSYSTIASSAPTKTATTWARTNNIAATNHIAPLRCLPTLFPPRAAETDIATINHVTLGRSAGTAANEADVLHTHLFDVEADVAALCARAEWLEREASKWDELLLTATSQARYSDGRPLPHIRDGEEWARHDLLADLRFQCAHHQTPQLPPHPNRH
jgi:hypothetical protein